MVPFTILMNLLMYCAVLFTITFFLMPFVMVRTVDSLAAFAVGTAVMAAPMMRAMSHDRGRKAP